MHTHGPAVPQGNGNLVLSRKSGEEILIGPNIMIRVVELRGHCVKLSVSAPKTMTVLRRELSEDQCSVDNRTDNRSDIENRRNK